MGKKYVMHILQNLYLPENKKCIYTHLKFKIHLSYKFEQKILYLTYFFFQQKQIQIKRLRTILRKKHGRYLLYNNYILKVAINLYFKQPKITFLFSMNKKNKLIATITLNTSQYLKFFGFTILYNTDIIFLKINILLLLKCFFKRNKLFKKLLEIETGNFTNYSYIRIWVQNSITSENSVFFNTNISPQKVGIINYSQS